MGDNRKKNEQICAVRVMTAAGSVCLQGALYD